jgi:hypothetical protein
MTSFRQVEANHRNALKSTGPRTEAGKLAHPIGVFSAKTFETPNLRLLAISGLVEASIVHHSKYPAEMS